MNTVSRGFLDAHFGAINPWLMDGQVIEIAVNVDGSVWVEKTGEWFLTQVAEPGHVDVVQTAKLIAGVAGMAISKDHPILSTRTTWKDLTLRVQVVAPPAVEQGAAISIRKYLSMDFKIADFKFLREPGKSGAPGHKEQVEAISDCIMAGDAERAMQLAVEGRLSVLISGGTSTAKTSLARAMINYVDPRARLITIEDAIEIQPKHQNLVELVADRDETSPRSADKLLQSSLRMRPDRIVVGELRGSEAWTFMEAINTGHGGSITTIHADSAKMAIERLSMMVIRAGIEMPFQEIHRYVITTIDLVIQLQRIDGVRGIDDIILI